MRIKVEDGNLMFSVKKIKFPELVYKHPSKLITKINFCDQFGWVVPNEKDTDFHNGKEKFLIADQYGGEGIGNFGGGVRCGDDPETGFQIKGIGSNPLIGVDAPLDYSHGGMSLFECLQETIWGNIFQRALPFGAIQIFAVLNTGLKCWWVFERWGEKNLEARYGVPPFLPRGLLVREKALRPSHFERAVLFKPISAFAREIPSDVSRVKEAVQRLPYLLPLNSNISDKEFTQFTLTERLEAGLYEMVRRFAIQSVAAKCKRLIHGNIGSSNICLDGRWIDYGRCTAIPGWGQALDFDPFWDDREIYNKIFFNLTVYIRKYLPCTELMADRLFENMSKKYFEEHRIQLQRRILTLIGIPFLFVDTLLQIKEIQSLVKTLKKRMDEGYNHPNGVHPDEHAKFGGLGLLSKIFRILSMRQTENETDYEFVDAIKNALILIYSEAEKIGISSTSIRKLMLINTAKASREMPILYRENMVREAEKIVLEAQAGDALCHASNQFIQNISDEVYFLYQEPLDCTTVIFCKNQNFLTYDALADKYLYRSKDAESSVQIDICTSVIPTVIAAREYWGSVFLKELSNGILV